MGGGPKLTKSQTQRQKVAYFYKIYTNISQKEKTVYITYLNFAKPQAQTKHANYQLFTHF